MDTFQLNILSASSAFYEGECESLVVPTPDGKRGVLAHHSNAIAAISPGELSYTVPGEKPRLAAVSHGMIKIEDNHVLVLVETAESRRTSTASAISRRRTRRAKPCCKSRAAASIWKRRRSWRAR